MTVHRSLLPLAFCMAALAAAPAEAAFSPGWRRLDLAAPASSYAMVYVPAGLPAGPVTAIVFLHGAGGSPGGWQATLEPLADELGAVLLLPKSAAPEGWGLGPDHLILREALRRLGDGVALDPARLGLAGYSAGGAYALEYAYSTRSPFAAVFALGAPYRTVVELADPAQPPPLRLFYGTADPNHAYLPWIERMLGGLGVEVVSHVAPGAGHDPASWPPAALGDGFRFLVERAAPACTPGPAALCLRGGRFRVEATWQTATATGAGQGTELTDESGSFWFFTPGNVELDVKVLDGCLLNDRFWVFAAGLTDVGVTITVTDTATGERREYRHARGTPFAPVQHTDAFPCS